MNEPYIILLVLGALAVSSGLFMLIFDIISIYLYQNSSPYKPEVSTFISCALHGMTLVLLVLLLCQFLKPRNRAHLYNCRLESYLISFAGVSWTLSTLVTILEFCLKKNLWSLQSESPSSHLSHNLIISAFFSGIVSIISQCAFIIYIASIQRRVKINFINEMENCCKFKETSASICTRPSSFNLKTNSKNLSFTTLTDSETSPSKRQFVEVCRERCVIRSTLLSLISRPKPTVQRGRSLDRDHINYNHQDPRLSNTSEISACDSLSFDKNSRQNFESKSNPTLVPRNLNTSFHFLETIPASPTENVELSSNFPPSPNPVRHMGSTRSFSTASSHRELRRYSRSVTPVDTTDESHIHPLFRTDSSNPPPAATPGTVVTAAPGAGQVISDHASIRSLKSKRSGSSLQTTMNKVNIIDNAKSMGEFKK